MEYSDSLDYNDLLEKLFKGDSMNIVQQSVKRDDPNMWRGGLRFGGDGKEFKNWVRSEI